VVVLNKPSGLHPAVYVLLATAGATCVGCGSSGVSSPGFREMGLASVLADTTRSDGYRLVAGVAAESEDDALVVVVVKRFGDNWRAQLVERSLNTGGSGGCNAEVTDDLIPGGQAIVVRCFSGGTNRVSYVRVFGVDPANGVATVFVTVSCAVTRPIVDGSMLRLESTGEQANASTPGAAQPDQTLTWSGFELVPTDSASFSQFCDYSYFGP
jgi:hypothetical protein